MQFFVKSQNMQSLRVVNVNQNISDLIHENVDILKWRYSGFAVVEIVTISAQFLKHFFLLEVRKTENNNPPACFRDGLGANFETYIIIFMFCTFSYRPATYLLSIAHQSG